MGGTYASLIRLELLTPATDLLQSQTYNKVFHAARNHYGFLLFDSVNSGDLGNFFDSDYDRRERFGVSEINLLSWYFYMAGGAFDAFRFAAGRR
jgi:cytochrome c oxidase subunit 1